MAQGTSFAKLLSLLAFTIPVYSQIGYNENSNTLLCSKPGGVYCVHGSLAGSTTISCVGPTTAEIRSCNIELSDILPKELAELAVCYESDPTAGNAVCAVNGTGFTLSHRTTIAVPETILCDTPFPKKNTSHQGILHQEINSRPPTQPQFTPIPLPPPVTLGYAPARETVRVESVVSCSNPWDRMPGGAHASHGSLPVYLVSSLTAPVSAESTGSIGYVNAQASSRRSRLRASASPTENAPANVPGMVLGDDLDESGQARDTGSVLSSGGIVQRDEPKGWSALLVVAIVLGCAGRL